MWFCVKNSILIYIYIFGNNTTIQLSADYIVQIIYTYNIITNDVIDIFLQNIYLLH